MSRHQSSLTPEYFETMFQSTHDPWKLESSPYEQLKYRHSIQALAGRKYAKGFEIGCAKGVLTNHLAPSVGELLAIDVSETALRAARGRCADCVHVTFAKMRFPKQAPLSSFDLIILSEVAYYWDDADLRATADWIRKHLNAGGTILLVHWIGETDYPQSGDAAVEKLQEALAGILRVEIAQRENDYRLDLWHRVA